MADGVTYQTTVATPAAGTEVATDDCGADGHAQVIKLAISTDGSATLIPATSSAGLRVNLHDGTDALAINADGSINVSGSLTVGQEAPLRLQATPGISTSAYAPGDSVGGLMTFSNANLASGGSCRIEAVQIADKASQLADLDLVFYDRSITAPTDNAVFDPTDTEITQEVGRVPVSAGYYAAYNDNAVASVNSIGLVAKLNGTNLYGHLVARTNATYASTSDLTVTVTVTPIS